MKQTHDTYILVWDMLGLEYVGNVSADDRNRTLASLRETEFFSKIPYQQIMLRARANSHRRYEIYLLGVDNSLDTDDIRDWFNSAPQDAVNFVRKNGTKLYSDHSPTQLIQ